MSTMQEKVDGLILGCNAMGWHSSAVFVKELAEQRAELLEACKAAEHNSLDLPEYVVSLLRQAITKAEAAE